MKKVLVKVLTLCIMVCCAICLFTACGGSNDGGAGGSQGQPSGEQGKQTFTVMFNYNGADNADGYPTTKELAVIDNTEFVFGLAKANYNFRGWEYNGVLVFDENGNKLTEVTLVNDMRFIAKFVETAKLTIVTNIEGAGTFSNTRECECYSYVDIFAHPYQGYNFLGWYNIDNESLEYDILIATEEDYRFLMWTEDTTIQAKFEIGSFDLYIYSNNTDLGQVYDTKSSVKVSVDASTIKHQYLSQVKITAITNTSEYRFLGWYDVNNQRVSPNAVYTFTMVNYDYTLEAKWNRFNISYDLKGGVQHDDNPTIYSVEDTLTLYTPTRTDYDFIGWEYLGHIITEINGSTAKHITVSAVWNAIEYAIEYDVATGENHPDNPTSYTIEDAITLKDPTRAGYTFTGWTENGNKVTGITKGSTGNKTFTANWEVVAELSNFNFTSTATTCTITGIKDKTITEIVVPDCVTEIREWAFYNCRSLTSVTIGNSVTSIGECAFYNCRSLTSVTFKNTSGWNVYEYGDMRYATVLSSSELSDTSTAATYLKSTYYDYYWKRT